GPAGADRRPGVGVAGRSGLLLRRPVRAPARGVRRPGRPGHAGAGELAGPATDRVLIMTEGTMDWYAWHEGYQDGRPLRRRLRLVQDQLRAALTEAPAGPVEIISVCAGQGHDVIGVLADSPRRSEVRALLVELDERNVAAARLRIAQSGLTGIEVRQADA